MVKHRRSNAGAGILLLVAALFVAFSAVLPWAHFSGPSLDLGGTTVEFGYDLTPGVDTADDDATRPLIAGLAVTLGALALALTATRVRGLGVLWRVLALLVVAVPAWFTWYFWSTAIADPGGFLEDSPELAVRALGSGARLAELFGVIDVQPGLGLWAMSSGCALGLIAVWIPARRSEVWMQSPAFLPTSGSHRPGLQPPPYPPPYPSAPPDGGMPSQIYPPAR